MCHSQPLKCVSPVSLLHIRLGKEGTVTQMVESFVANLRSQTMLRGHLSVGPDLNNNMYD